MQADVWYSTKSQHVKWYVIIHGTMTSGHSETLGL